MFAWFPCSRSCSTFNGETCFVIIWVRIEFGAIRFILKGELLQFIAFAWFSCSKSCSSFNDEACFAVIWVSIEFGGISSTLKGELLQFGVFLSFLYF